MYEKSIFRAIVEDEYNRSNRMLIAYKEEIEKLPKGNIYIKKRNNHKYYYLKYQENNKKIVKYIKHSEIELLQDLINKRNHYEDLIKNIQRELKEMEYMFNYKGWKNDNKDGSSKS